MEPSPAQLPNRSLGRRAKLVIVSNSYNVM